MSFWDRYKKIPDDKDGDYYFSQIDEYFHLKVPFIVDKEYVLRIPSVNDPKSHYFLGINEIDNDCYEFCAFGSASYLDELYGPRAQFHIFFGGTSDERDITSFNLLWDCTYESGPCCPSDIIQCGLKEVEKVFLFNHSERIK